MLNQQSCAPATFTLYTHHIVENYADEYTTLFGPRPDLSHLPRNAGPVADPEAAANWKAISLTTRDAITRIYANIGKSIEAYEQPLIPGDSRFGKYVVALSNMTANLPIRFQARMKSLA